MDDLENRKAFLRYYRIREETFDKLVQLLAPHLEKNAHMARECVVCTVFRVLASAVPQFLSILSLLLVVDLPLELDGAACTGVLSCWGWFWVWRCRGRHNVYTIHDDSSIHRVTWYCTRLTLEQVRVQPRQVRQVMLRVQYWYGFGSGDVEVDIIYIPFMMTAQYTGLLGTVQGSH